jgi:hypothetical protein
VKSIDLFLDRERSVATKTSPPYSAQSALVGFVTGGYEWTVRTCYNDGSAQESRRTFTVAP